VNNRIGTWFYRVPLFSHGKNICVYLRLGAVKFIYLSRGKTHQMMPKPGFFVGARSRLETGFLNRKSSSEAKEAA
jgi:hypothetical protein